MLAFRRAAVVGIDEQLRALRRSLATEQRAASAGDVRAARQAGADFHEAVIAMAGNALLSELFGVTRSRMRWLLGQHSDLVPMAEEHAGLYQALADHDPDRAAALAQDHLVTSRPCRPGSSGALHADEAADARLAPFTDIGQRMREGSRACVSGSGWGSRE